MPQRFLATAEPAPPGFEVRIPSKSDLLRGSLVLLVRDEQEGDELLHKLWSRFFGVVVIPGEHPALEQLGPLAWKLKVDAPLVPHLAVLLRGFLSAVSSAKKTRAERAFWQKECDRLNLVHAAVREHYNLVTERLRQHVGQVSRLNEDLKSQLERIQLTEKALSAKERELAITIHSLGEAVVATHENTSIRLMNPAAESLCGYTLKQASGRPLSDVFPLTDVRGQPIIQDILDELKRDGRAQVRPRGAVLKDHRGENHRVAHTAARVQDGENHFEGYVFVFRDITDQVLLEEELQQSQRLDSLGQLAGGVAHDFNNMLMGITGFAELLESHLQGNDDGLKLLNSIQTASKRAAGLTRQLLTFARKQMTQKDRVSIHQIIHEVIELASHTFDRRIRTQADLTATHHHVLGEPTQLQTALLNLLLNARDAMPEGGVITIRTRPASPPDNGDEKMTEESSPWIQVDVEDTGVGIPASQLQHVFEPFFTTKDPGKGTGLGLATLYGIIKGHQGTVTVESQVGKGTRFVLRFPTVAPKTHRSPAPTTPMGHGHILVVEDEKAIRDFLNLGLPAHGYQVSFANHGKHALDMITADPHGYDLVLLDLNMPTMNGRDALVAIRAINPDLPVIIASGYVTDQDRADLKKLGANLTLTKPYGLRQIVAKISSQLSK